MRVIVRHIFGDLDPFFDFAECTGPHVEMELDVLPVVGGIFHLTPKEKKHISEQYIKDPEINATMTSWYEDGASLDEEIDDLLEGFRIVSTIAFTYDSNGERFVLIGLIEE